MQKFLISLLALICSFGIVQAQTVSITGKVVSNLEGVDEPVIGASILLKGTTTGTVTDVNGRFSLENVPVGGTLSISSISFKTEEVVITADCRQYDVILTEDTQFLEEIVVIGFGTRRKADLTEAVSTVDTKFLESRPVTNLSQSLQGTVPGLNLSVGGYGGQLGQTMDINIRGTGTISTGSTASTLVLIDGVEGDMNSVNPDDVESISVLKDAASSSIYGSRAAFGVILITTKSGKAGKPSVSYSGNARYSGPNHLPNVMNSWEFANFFNEGNVNGGGSPIFNEETLGRIQKYIAGEITTTTIPNESNGLFQFHEKANDNVNWYKTHYKWAWGQEHNVNINGGTDKARYYASLNYLDQNGNLRYGDDRFNRLTANAKFNAKPTKWLDLEVSAKYVRSHLDNPLYSDLGGLLYHDIVRMWPMMPFKDPNGYFMRNGKLIQLTNGSRSKTDTNNWFIQGQLVFHPLEGWDIHVSAGLSAEDRLKLQNLNKVYEHKTTGEPVCLQAYGGSYAAGQTGAFQNWTKNSHFTTSVYTDYTRTIDKHSFKVMAGMNAEKFSNRYTALKRMDLISENVPEIGAATGADVITDNSAFQWATVGFFGRVNYDYGGKYFVSGNIRYDGSSRFRAADRWGLFGSFSLGWNIAAEDFFNVDKHIISQLKPRFSWGTLGNQNTNSYYPTYLLQDITTNGGSWLMDKSKPTIATMPATISSSLTWETVQSTDAGIDLVMFDGRLNFNFDYFIRKTLNMVGPASEIASIYGVGMPAANNTDLSTKGWELAVNWRGGKSDFFYNVGFNMSDARTFVDRYPNESKSLNTYYAGMELGEIWGYTTEGIAKSQEQMDAWIANNNPSWGSGWGEGDIMYRDLNSDKSVSEGANTVSDPGDRRIIGNSTPRFRYGLDFGLEWKGLGFSMFWQGVAKRDLWLDGPMFWGLNGGEWQSTGLKEHLDYYRPENTTSVFGANTNAYYPKIYMDKSMNQKVQTRYMHSGAYIRLKNIQLSYTFQDNVTRKLKMQKLRVYVSAENLFTISGLPSGFDPETAYSNYTGSNSGKTYPLQTTVSLGLNVTF